MEKIISAKELLNKLNDAAANYDIDLYNKGVKLAENIIMDVAGSVLAAAEKEGKVVREYTCPLHVYGMKHVMFDGVFDTLKKYGYEVHIAADRLVISF